MAVTVMDFLILGAISASGISCVFLLVGLCRLPRLRRSILLVRQLTHLAAADLAFAAVQVPACILNTGIDAGWTLEGVPKVLRDPFCDSGAFLQQIGNQASMIFECHLALTFAASIYKSPRGLQALSQCLPYAWLLAFAFAILSPVLGHFKWNADVPDNPVMCATEYRNWMTLSSILIVFATCSICYIISTVHVHTAGATVQLSVGARAKSYLLAAALTNGPIAVYNVVPISLIRNYPGSAIFTKNFWFTWYQVATMLYNLSGLLHYAIYAVQCRRARKLVANERPGAQQRDVAFRVDFRDAESVCDLSCKSSGAETELSAAATNSLENEPPAGEDSGDYFVQTWADVSWFVDESPPGAQRSAAVRCSGSSHGSAASSRGSLRSGRS